MSDIMGIFSVLLYVVAGLVTMRLAARTLGPGARPNFMEDGGILFVWPMVWLVFVATFLMEVIPAIAANPRNYASIVRNEMSKFSPSENQERGMPPGFPWC